MDQEITVSKNWIKLLFEDHLGVKKIDYAKKSVDMIEQNFFISDKNRYHISNLFTELESHPDGNRKELIAEILRYLSVEKIKPIDIQHFENTSNEILLAENSEDKIYFDPYLTEKEIKKLSKKHLNIEIHNKNSLVKPFDYHRFRIVPDNIKFQKDVRFDLIGYLKPYLKYAKNIKIIDPFLANTKAFFNLKNLFEFINISCKIEIQIYSLNDYLNSNKSKKMDYESNYALLIKKINELKKTGFNIEIIEFKTKKHKGRFIITDKVEIQIPGGLDCINQDGFPTIEENETSEKLSVNFINE